MAIPDGDYAAGLERLRRDVSAAPDADLTARSEFVVVAVIGDRPWRARSRTSE